MTWRTIRTIATYRTEVCAEESWLPNKPLVVRVLLQFSADGYRWSEDLYGENDAQSYSGEPTDEATAQAAGLAYAAQEARLS